MPAELYLIFRWSIKGRGEQLGSMIAPSRYSAWEAARKMHGPGVNVISKRDHDAELVPEPPRAA